ncbi:GNAT family N-acetyltransferase [Pseudomonas sp. NCCP-436]|uniref:GNAT family N-acetyltransferase n=1 Tax=Pseudomonas sp. NCCP-436 TaxID=2842481 RepID=UPI001C8274DD|nr:GNAT family N-acetyltransferase [Pseudomonas sp. NCCP-436]GIZ12642.1 N-acetyltransferase [Pseudomonas sp. NCCP-436]
MHVNPAAPADLDTLVPLFAAYLRFYRVVRSEAEVARFLGERLERGDSRLFVACNEAGAALGFVQLYPFHASLELKSAWLLSDLYVDEAARRRGVGEALMQAARRHAEASGACGLQLETAASNHQAQRLYERLGYRRDTVFHTYWLALGN